MNPISLIPRAVGIFLCLGLALPSPAYALKPLEPQEGSGRRQLTQTFLAGLEETGDPVGTLLFLAQAEMLGWVDSPAVAARNHWGKTPNGTQHVVVLWSGRNLKEATMVSLAVHPKGGSLFLRVRIAGQIVTDSKLLRVPPSPPEEFTQQVLEVLRTQKSRIARAMNRKDLPPSAQAELLAQEEEAVPGWPQLAETREIFSIPVLPASKAGAADAAQRQEWYDWNFKILETLQKPEEMRRMVEGQLARYGRQMEIVEHTSVTLAILGAWLKKMAAEGASPEAKEGAVAREFFQAWASKELLARLERLSRQKEILLLLDQPFGLERRYLEAVARLAAGKDHKEDLPFWRETRRRFQKVVKESWEVASRQTLQESILRQAVWSFPARDEERQKRQLPSGRYYLASAALNGESLLREMESLSEAQEVHVDWGDGTVRESLGGVRQRLWNDLSLWEKTFSLYCEAQSPSAEGLVVRVSLAPVVELLPVAKKGVVLVREPLSFAAATVETLHWDLAQRFFPAGAERDHFLAVPVDEVISVERQGQRLAHLSEAVRLANGDKIYLSFPPEPSPKEDLTRLAQALYRVRDLFDRYFEIGHKGPFGLRDWRAFLEAAREQDPRAYGDLKKLPVPEGNVVHANLLRHKPSGQGFLISGNPASGKSLLSAVLAGNPKKGWAQADRRSRWELLANDTVLLLRFGDQLVAGMPLVEPHALTTRFPLKGATRVRKSPRHDAYSKARVLERQAFVPLGGIVWLNRSLKSRGSRSPAAILGLTARDVGTHLWSEAFQDRFRELPVKEEFTGSTSGIKKFQAVADGVSKWAEGVVQSEPPDSGSAGLEEVTLLQPGHPSYAQLFPKGLSAQETLAKQDSPSLRSFLTGLPPQSPAVLRLLPSTPQESRAWQDEGLQPLLDPNDLRQHLLDNLFAG
ncbi:MAG: hypothetical protein HYS41_05405, partial [Candidatus Omnitrophica bacterium]|nr:hypothetical protein [Candidatus Omnitrophota bacterium]